MLEGLPGLLVAFGVLAAVAVGVLVAVTFAHWSDQRPARRDHRPSRDEDHRSRRAPDPVVEIRSPRPAPPMTRARPPEPAARGLPVLPPAPVADVEPPPPGSRRAVVPPSPAQSNLSTADLRRWARAEGLRIADRGPIPARIRQAWSDAHPRWEDAPNADP